MTMPTAETTVPAAAPIRILIADDHFTVREGLAAIIGRQSDMLVVGAAGNGQECIDLWRQHVPDVTLIDLSMPVLDGIGAIEAIRQDAPSALFIVLTTFGTDQDIFRSIKAGARAYMLKDAQREELLDCIRAVHAGETRIAPLLVAKLAAQVSGEALTRRELEVLALLARGRSNKNIALRLSISETTVKSHLRSVFNKLQVLSRTEAIAVASQRGLIHL